MSSGDSEASGAIHWIMKKEGEAAKILVQDVIPVEEVPQRLTSEIHVRLHEGDTDEGDLQRLKRLCEEFPGESRLVLCVICSSGDVALIRCDGGGIKNCPDFRGAVSDIFGSESFLQKPNSERPQRRRRSPYAAKQQPVSEPA